MWRYLAIPLVPAFAGTTCQLIGLAPRDVSVSRRVATWCVLGHEKHGRSAHHTLGSSRALVYRLVNQTLQEVLFEGQVSDAISARRCHRVRLDRRVLLGLGWMPAVEIAKAYPSRPLGFRLCQEDAHDSPAFRRYSLHQRSSGILCWLFSDTRTPPVAAAP